MSVSGFLQQRHKLGPKLLQIRETCEVGSCLMSYQRSDRKRAELLKQVFRMQPGTFAKILQQGVNVLAVLAEY